MNRYRSPTTLVAMLAASLMSAEAIAAHVASSHETMRAEVERVLTAGDRAARLLLGEGEFAGVWSSEPSETDGGQADVLANAIASLCAPVAGQLNPWPAVAIGLHLQRIAELDVSHPLVAHRAVLHAACRPLGGEAPDWSELDAFASSSALLAAGPSVGQPCDFYPADGSAARDAVVTHVWGPTCVNLAWTENGAPASATSVSLQRVALPGMPYYAVLRPVVASQAAD